MSQPQEASATPWKEVGSDRWEKPAGIMERAFHDITTPTRAAGREEICICPVFTFSASPSVSSADMTNLLRKGWAAFRFHHPDIAVDQADGSLFYQKLTSQSDLDAWLSDTFSVKSDVHAPAEDCFTDCGAPSIGSLYYFPHTSQILLKCPHWRMDLRSCCITMKTVLHLATTCRADYTLFSSWQGGETSNLNQSYEHLVAEAAPYSSDVNAFVGKMFQGVLATGTTAVVPTKAPGILQPGRTLRTRHHFSKEDSAAIFKACKSHGYTVTEAIESAVVMASFNAANTEHKDANFVVYRGRDTRRDAPEKYKSAAFERAPNSCAYIEMIPLVQPKAFHEVAEYLSRTVRPALDKQLFIRSLSAIAEMHARIITGPKPEGFVPPSDAVITSVGILNDYLDGQYTDAATGRVFSIDDVQLQLEILGRQWGCMVYTWNGRLSMSPCFNEVYYDVETINGVLEHVVKTLKENLGIA